MARANKATAPKTEAATTATVVPVTDAEPAEDVTTEGVVAEAEALSSETSAEATSVEATPETTKPKVSKKPTAVLKCSVNQALLKTALDRVRGSLPTRKSLPNPAIGLYRLVADRAATTLSVTTYNEVVATTVTIPANVVIAGELLASKDLYELISQLPDAGITLAAETPNRLQVIMDSRTFSPNSMSAANYPDLLTDDGDKEAEHRFEVSASAFGKALGFVCPGALTEGSDAEASIFNALRLDLWQGKKGAVFALAASDDSSLVVDESTVDATIDRNTPQMTVAVPVKSLEILSKLLDEPGEETLKISLHSGTGGSHPTLCLFTCGGDSLLTHLVTSQWPDYLKHVPKREHFQGQVVADRQLLLSLVSCNLVFAIAKTYRTMMLDPFAEDEKISTWVKTQSKGESVQEMVATVKALNDGDLSQMKPFAFNASQVKLALTLFSDTEICWQFIGPGSPTLLNGGTKGRWIILMPIAVNDGEENELPDPVEPTTKKTKKTAK